MVGSNASNGKSSHNRAIDLPKDYQSSLMSFWEWRPKMTVERVTTSLALDTCPQMENSLYRLWIEALAQSKEHASLRSLLKHLSFYVDHSADAQTFAALKGLIHFELDEIEACRLLLKAVKGQGPKSNPFVWELEFKMLQRTSGSLVHSRFKKHRDHLLDYFHLETYGKAALLVEDTAELSWVYNKMQELYPKAPFSDLVEFHSYLNTKEFKKALSPAKRLVDRFSLNIEYGFSLGYVLAKEGRYDEAIIELSRVHDLFDEDDLDVLNWLGLSLAKKAVIEEDQKLREKAENVLQKAIDLGIQNGIPVSFPSRELAQLQNHFGKDSISEGKIPKFWLLKVDAQKYHRFRTAPLEEVSFFETSLDEKASRGDYCFVFGDDHNPHTNRWRFGAMFKVESDPIFSLQYRFLNQLSLMHRPDVSVPVEVEEFGRGFGAKAAFELDEAALHSVVESIVEHLDGEKDGVYQALKHVQL